MKSQLRAAIVCLIVLTVLTGVIYPAIVTLAAGALFPKQAAGSVIIRDGQAVGSELIGQSFTDPKYFWGRLSATPVPYTAFDAKSGVCGAGSNLAPTNPALIDAARARIQALAAADPIDNPSSQVVLRDSQPPIPIDLVTASASGLDPQISPAAAEFQAIRIARVRRLPLAQVQALIAQHTQGRSLGILGEPRVNVLELNLALDQAAAR